MLRTLAALGATFLVQGAAFADEQPMGPLRPDQVAFRALVAGQEPAAADRCGICAQ